MERARSGSARASQRRSHWHGASRLRGRRGTSDGRTCSPPSCRPAWRRWSAVRRTSGAHCWSPGRRSGFSREHRLQVDAAIGSRLADLGDRQVECEVKQLAYGLDPLGFLARSRAATKDRRVTLRPAPDTMARLTALLPAAAGVAAYAALTATAQAARAAGDQRGRGQVMADTLVERVTGQQRAGDEAVEIQVVMTDRTVVVDGAQDAAAHIVGYGAIPAGVARDLIRETAATAWIRRFYTAPGGRRLAAMDSRRRLFSRQLRRAVIVRDEVCRAPWCGAPIRHIDHVVGVAGGGRTSLDNAQGLCEACNYARRRPDGARSRDWAGLGSRSCSPHRPDTPTPAIPLIYEAARHRSRERTYAAGRHLRTSSATSAPPETTSGTA